MLNFRALFYVASDGTNKGDDERALRLEVTLEADGLIEILRRVMVEWLPFDNLVVDGRNSTIIGCSGPMRKRDDEMMGRWIVDCGLWMADCGS